MFPAPPGLMFTFSCKVDRLGCSRLTSAELAIVDQTLAAEDVWVLESQVVVRAARASLEYAPAKASLARSTHEAAMMSNQYLG